MATLEQLCEIQLGKMLSPKSRTGLRPRPYLRNANVLWNRFDLSSILEMDFSEDEEEKFLLRKGDVLVCEGGEPGRAAVWDAQLSSCLYQKALLRLRPRDGVVDPHFVMFRLWLGAVTGEFTGDHAKTTIAHLPEIRLKALRIAVPPMAEQKRIASVLSDGMAQVERAGAAAEAQCDAARALRLAELRETFEGPCAGVWDWKLLEEVLAEPMKTGISRPEARGSTKYCLTLSSVRHGWLDTTARKPIDVTEVEAASNWVRPGAFYIVRGNGNRSLVGRAALAPASMDLPVLYPDLLIQLILNREVVDTAFFQAAWDNPRTRADLEARARTSAGIFKINQENLGKIRIPIPTLSEQRRIAAALGKRFTLGEGLRESAAERVRQLTVLPAALLREAFSGEL